MEMSDRDVPRSVRRKMVEEFDFIRGRLNNLDKSPDKRSGTPYDHCAVCPKTATERCELPCYKEWEKVVGEK